MGQRESRAGVHSRVGVGVCSRETTGHIAPPGVGHRTTLNEAFTWVAFFASRMSMYDPAALATAAPLWIASVAFVVSGFGRVLYGAIVGNLLVFVMAIAMCIHHRKMVLRFSFGPSLIAGTWLAVMVHG